MNFDDNITEVFDRYLTGQMTEAEEQEFLEQLNTDPSLKQAYEAHRAIVAGIREARRDELKDYIKKNAKIRYIGNVWGPKWVMASAAIVVVLLSAYIVIEYAVNPNQKSKEVATAEKTEDAVTEEPTEENTEVANEAVAEDATDTEVIADSSLKGNPLNSKELDSYYSYEGLNDKQKAETMPEIKKSVPVITKSSAKDLNKVTVNKNIAETIDVYYEVSTTLQYKYSGNKLTLYRFPYEDDVVIYQTGGDTDYLAWQRAYYPLSKDNKIHPLKRLIDGEILKQLPTLE
jgi:hypothetical protein